MISESSKVIDGQKLAHLMNLNTQKSVEAHHLKPYLAVILLGDDDASLRYAQLKARCAKRLGIVDRTYHFSSDLSQDQLLKVIQRLDQNPKVTGILVQMPLPKQINEPAVAKKIAPEKDVDGMNPVNLGRLAINDRDGFYPKSCTALGIVTMLDHYAKRRRFAHFYFGQHVLVVGRSRIVGRPLSLMMVNRGAEVTILNHYVESKNPKYAHYSFSGLEQFAIQADILISAVGKPNLINSAMIRRGAIIVDVGENYYKGHLVGDVRNYHHNVLRRSNGLTPVPGGVGPMTTATLMRQTVQCTEYQLKLKQG